MPESEIVDIERLSELLLRLKDLGWERVRIFIVPDHLIFENVDTRERYYGYAYQLCQN